jgi:hypothetical protein
MVWSGIICVGSRESRMAAMMFNSIYRKMHLRRKLRTTEPEIERECECPKPSPREHHATITTQFQPLDPGIVSDTIPAFFIGRNMEGLWIARDAKGQNGGIFLLQNSALTFAKRNSGRRGCATIFPSERFELDLESRGNPPAKPLVSLIRIMRRFQQVLAAFFGKATKVVRRLPRVFRFL